MDVKDIAKLLNIDEEYTEFCTKIQQLQTPAEAKKWHCIADAFSRLNNTKPLIMKKWVSLSEEAIQQLQIPDEALELHEVLPDEMRPALLKKWDSLMQQVQTPYEACILCELCPDDMKPAAYKKLVLLCKEALQKIQTLAEAKKLHEVCPYELIYELEKKWISFVPQLQTPIEAKKLHEVCPYHNLKSEVMKRWIALTEEAIQQLQTPDEALELYEVCPNDMMKSLIIIKLNTL
ncbi:MAG: hypothetical protein CR972_01570 [Candidatus Moraniibacteriota bacterium]|nr:MAG: hypothetical protein CR972_01570 [Candidatus Moranbacteria bacterium]